MFQKLKNHWQVNNLNLFLILLTFALGGSTCGQLAKYFLSFTNLSFGFVFCISYLIILTLLWPIAVLLISIPLGQYSFFKNYLKRVGQRIFRNKKISKQDFKKNRIAIFASGTGSNAEKIIQYFNHSNSNITVELIVCNNENANVLNIADLYKINKILVEKKSFFNELVYVNQLKKHEIDYIILAGFLWKVPDQIINLYPKKIINIHPSLLPKYGGRGMYGHYVHEAVLANHDNETGITIHYVNSIYDNGEIIFQAKCKVDSTDNVNTITQKVHALEQEHFAKTIERIIGV